MRHRDSHARHEVTSFMTSLQFLLFALRVTLKCFTIQERTGFTVLLLLSNYNN